MKIADANIFLRYLINDNEQAFRQAKEMLENNDVFLPVEVLCEIVYVLQKVYQIDRAEIQHALGSLIEQPGISIQNRDVVGFALRLFKSSKLDFVDCLLVGYSKVNGDTIYTFDEKLHKHIS